MIEKIIASSVRNPFLVLVMLAVLIATGFWSLLRTPLDAIPDLSDTQVIIFSEWMGRSPDLVEDQISYPIVTTMLSAPHVKAVRGQSMFGMSFVYVIFEDGTDIYWARSRVLEYMSEVRTRLPEGVNPILGPDATGVGWGFQYALVDESGKHNLAELRSLQDWYLRYQLKSVPGVADVASIGGFVKQYQITLDPTVLAAYDLTLDQVMMAVRGSNQDVGGRSLELSGREYVVRGRGYLKSLKDLENIAVTASAGGTPVLLRDIARVALGPEMRRGIAELDGKGEVAGGVVVVRFGENVMTVIDRVKARLAEIKSTLPPGVKIVTTYDRSDLIRGSINTLRENLIEEMIIISLICVVFLFHVRSALVAIITLPIAVLLAFIPMYFLGISANIMSLGGIAIAIGDLVDSAVVMIENAHKKLEEAAKSDQPADRKAIILSAAQEMGRPLFFSLLIITVSFLPVFTLEAQEGKLFKPLVYTKTFSMFFAALLSITLVPLLMSWLIRGRIKPEGSNPVNRLLQVMLRPVLKLALRLKWGVVGLSLAGMLLTVPVFLRLGSEFMPPLWEGTSLYMPSVIQGISVTEASRLLQLQDKLIKTVPEVVQVFGKAGKADTATDPAPVSMTETIITLKPQDQWRPGLTPDKLIAELNAKLEIPGVVNTWTMPIKGRIDMLSTGIRTPLGIKIFAKSITDIEKLGIEIETVLKPLTGSRNIYFERQLGGYFLDFDLKREAIARYGLSVSEVETTIETAIGGMNVTTTIEGRERYPVNIRYARELRDDPNELGRVLVTAMGRQIPLAQLADIRIKEGPPMIRTEAGQYTGSVYIDIEGMDIGSYVQATDKLLKQRLQAPAQTTWRWSGQFEYMERASRRLMVVIPITLVAVVLLLYLIYRSFSKLLLTLLTLPMAIIGSIWGLWLLGYDMSVAVWVGIIGLIGVSAETGVVMLISLDESYMARQGDISSRPELAALVLDAAASRIRPLMMTNLANIIGLMPIMLDAGPGSDTMKRIAAPMIGGMLSSTTLALIVLPVIYFIWRGWSLPRQFQTERVLLMSVSPEEVNHEETP
ncbi:MAG: efflux RND transporter permease subunit [Candidatus Sericytochromatia bacterium]|nr:efflux RND transporter permease subunit [Candidatus Sericytochromatia bacterium]